MVRKEGDERRRGSVDAAAPWEIITHRRRYPHRVPCRHFVEKRRSRNTGHPLVPVTSTVPPPPYLGMSPPAGAGHLNRAASTTRNK